MPETIQRLGSRIALYRKKMGLTQGALAEKLCISTQAVSRWERGGAPDAAILPALANALHVTIDQLYGIPSGQHMDIPQLLAEAFQDIPREQLFEAAYHYAYAILKAALDSYEQSGEEFHKMLDTHESVDRRAAATPPSYLVHVSSDLGMMSASFANDLHYLFVMPEPKDGFASIMKNQEAYMRLFQLLSQEHRLDALLFLYGDSREGFTASKAARELAFVSCDVMPDINQDIDIEINDDDLRIDTYRSSGAGGQHINKTSSAIRITHLPTGIVVQCQNERSQLQNKDKAMKMLKAKLYLLKQQEEQEKKSGIRGEIKEIGWGSQIRSYVMQPYTMVKDHRTNEETGNVSSVLDGNIDQFINAYLKQNSIQGK